MLYRQKWRFLAEQQARYFLFFIIGLFIFYQALGHDIGIYNSFRNGEADREVLQQLYFKQWTYDQLRTIDMANIAAMFILAGYAILIKIAQRQVEKVGYSF